MKNFFNVFFKSLLCSVALSIIITPIMKCSADTKKSSPYVEIFNDELKQVREEISQQKENLSPTEYTQYKKELLTSMKEMIDSEKNNDDMQVFVVRDFLYKLKYANKFCLTNKYILSSNYNNAYKKIYNIYEITADKKFYSLPKSYQSFWSDLTLEGQPELEDSAIKFWLNQYEELRSEIQQEMPNLTIQEFCEIVDADAELFLMNSQNYLKELIPDFLNN